MEQKYELSIPGHDWTLYGYIDLIYKSFLVDARGQPLLDDEGQPQWVPVVVDHKTVTSAPFDAKKPDRENDWLAENTFNHEVIGYALAFRVLFGMTEDRFEYHWAIKTKVPKILITRVKVTDTQIRWFIDLAVEQIERIKRGYFERNLNSWKHTPKLCPAWKLCHGLVDEPATKGKLVIV